MIQIKKRISLDFLGDEYKEAYLEFTSVPIREYQKLLADSRKTADDPVKSVEFMANFLSDRFVGGKFPQDGELKDVVKDQLTEFDAEVFLRAFQTLTGQIDPKV